jgi:hypothetical protein
VVIVFAGLYMANLIILSFRNSVRDYNDVCAV